MKHIAALFIVWIFTFSNCKALKPETMIIVVLSAEKQKKVTVHKGDTLLVKLPMASGTGFVWEVSGKPNFCKQGDTKYEHVKKSVPGAPLMEVMSFSVMSSGAEDIHFIYHRPFERSNPPAKTKVLHLIIQ